jgi:hypothetical protein
LSILWVRGVAYPFVTIGLHIADVSVKLLLQS